MEDRHDRRQERQLNQQNQMMMMMMMGAASKVNMRDVLDNNKEDEDCK